MNIIKALALSLLVSTFTLNAETIPGCGCRTTGFSITTGQSCAGNICVTISPDQGEYKNRDSLSITWTPQDGSYDIWLEKNGDKFFEPLYIGRIVARDGFTRWTIPSYIPPGKNYFLALSGFQGAVGVNSQFFTIISPVARITSILKNGDQIEVRAKVTPGVTWWLESSDDFRVWKRWHGQSSYTENWFLGIALGGPPNRFFRLSSD